MPQGSLAGEAGDPPRVAAARQAAVAIQSPVVLTAEVSAAPNDVPPPIALVTPATVLSLELEVPAKPPASPVLALTPLLPLPSPPVPVVAPKLVVLAASPVTFDVLVDVEVVDAVLGRGPTVVFCPDPGGLPSASPSAGAPAAPPSTPETGGGDVSSLGGRSLLELQDNRPTTNQACQIDKRRRAG